ncbi:hypothetical protein CXF83_14870 [Shewanella sp. Choline-02u-19]|nr:hypothetical protein CXF83_14870 [Shewanella sp. Choline-02u-19]
MHLGNQSIRLLLRKLWHIGLCTKITRLQANMMLSLGKVITMEMPTMVISCMDSGWPLLALVEILPREHQHRIKGSKIMG